MDVTYSTQLKDDSVADIIKYKGDNNKDKDNVCH